MKKVLWISPYVPYDEVAHAGGKTHNYYIKYLHQTGLFDIHLITLAEGADVPYMDLDKYGISNEYAVLDGNFIKNAYRMIYNINSMVNKTHWLCQIMPSYHYSQLKKMILRYAEKETPDIVIMQWTRAAFLLPLVKELFPECYTVVIEEDVSFLGYERRYQQATSERDKRTAKHLYERLKKKELALLESTDYILVNNGKDKQLLIDSNISDQKVYVCAPYYTQYKDVKREDIQPEILFLGAMHREENHQCVMWFIEHVMPGLTDTDIGFTVIGNNPKDELKRQESDRIHIKGYVEDVAEYFSRGLCMAAPLKLGAGIKVKVLEALSAGIPVLTNSVGMEGISAVDNEEYFYCETAEDYVRVIKKLRESKEEQLRVGENARQFMERTYNIDKCLDEFIKHLQES